MKTLSERIAAALQESGKSQTELAKACGISPTSVNNWISGETKTMKAATAHRAASFLGVNFLWLTEGTGLMRGTFLSGPSDQLPSPPSPEFLAISRVLFKLSAGVTGYQVEPLEGNGPPIFFRRDWVEQRGYQASKLFAVKVSGASMEPALFDGDLVVINTIENEPKDGEAFAANYEGELVIKRLKRDSGEWWLSSDNSDKRRYPDKRCDENASLIGRVVYRQSERV